MTRSVGTHYMTVLLYPDGAVREQIPVERTKLGLGSVDIW
uniref:Uncharacterized protein n=1 Tax=Candidatus Kentrum sp. DK TaxID=2126562 RepID=A0A450S2L5_9GAMM|nr:MAG: hypothetical protein BECKDK2373C_GA0170839_10139 [Candidatus Kentron sp. DK]VFJ47605.1 MAG: hypothetical protein BECKDK2373B_GA0170837_101748 [Candidatus Kentron sp. DK]